MQSFDQLQCNGRLRNVLTLEKQRFNGAIVSRLHLEGPTLTPRVERNTRCKYSCEYPPALYTRRARRRQEMPGSAYRRPHLLSADMIFVTCASYHLVLRFD